VFNTNSSATTFVTSLCTEVETCLRLGKRGDALRLLEANKSLIESYNAHSQALFLLCYGKALTADAFSTGRPLDEALSTLTYAKKLADALSDERLQADILDALGEVYYVKGHKVSSDESDYPTGLHYFQQALDLREKQQEEYGLCRSSLNVGRMYQNLGQGEDARSYFERARQVAKQQQRIDVQAEAILHLALLDAENDSEAAIQLATEALALRESADLKSVLPHSYLALAELHHSQGNLPEARDYYQKCYKLAQELFMTQSVVFALLGMGYIHLDSGETLQAREHFEQAYALSQAIGLKGGIEEATEALQEVAT
jgi:tetratricopeptide (TPR) repeat protein